MIFSITKNIEIEDDVDKKYHFFVRLRKIV
jgi:hypothetical protein